MKITLDMVEKKIERINLFFKTENPKWNTVGAYLINIGNGGYTLERVANIWGGVDNTFRIGYVSKPDFYKYLVGFEACLQEMESRRII